ncbi:MAG: G1 family endopeptidase [Candidatus Bathyarchaeota archaeon]|nr:G1 family endopeptidase [Candidatus Bathyarchaeota archaeon]
MHKTRRKLRTRAISLILLWILLFAVSLALLQFLLETFLRTSQVSSVESLDWAGYVVAGSASSPQQEVTGVSASWTVPAVAASAGDTFSAAWIGIGGFLDRSLIQVGTEHDFMNGQPTYSVWYEMLPNDSITINAINVSPGDVVSASIRLVDSDTNEWFIQIFDVTNGQSFNQNFVYNSSRLSAEWIVERPTVNNRISTLADFGSITFRDTTVTVNHTVNQSDGAISSFPFSQVVMNNRQNVQLASVSSISAGGSSFTVTYLASS